MICFAYKFDDSSRKAGTYTNIYFCRQLQLTRIVRSKLKHIGQSINRNQLLSTHKDGDDQVGLELKKNRVCEQGCLWAGSERVQAGPLSFGHNI